VLAGGAVLMVIGCAVGPAVLGAAASSVIGGWLGIACAVIVAAAAGLVMHRRRRLRASECTHGAVSRLSRLHGHFIGRLLWDTADAGAVGSASLQARCPQGVPAAGRLLTM
jgi:hypothetical protein